MDLKRIEEKINLYKSQGKRMFVTSSFQTHSIPLLHIISKIDSAIPVFYLQTGYLFPETLVFIEEITRALSLNTKALYPVVPKFQQKDENGNLLFTSDPDYCCYLNKTQPLEPILAEYDIWINGIRADQSAVRKSMKIEQEAPHGAMRFHPMLDWNSKMISDYRKDHQLPPHPLEAKGYLSIGCEPCTRKFISDHADERSGRWFGLNKVECGLHTDLAHK